MAKDSAPRLAQETGQALGLVRAQHAMRSAAQLNAQALTGTLRMMHSCVSSSTHATPSDRLPPTVESDLRRSGSVLTAVPWSRDICSESEPP
eukprot:4134094-Amphidinium_carterae.1